MRCQYCYGRLNTAMQCESCGKYSQMPVSTTAPYETTPITVVVPEPSTPPAHDPRDKLIEKMGEALERSKWTLEKFADDKNDDSCSPTATARVAQDEPYIHLNMVESALAAWQEYKEGK